jgi:hypothetical protein
MRAVGDGAAVVAEEICMIRPVVTTEAPGAPVLLSLYADHGLVARAELSPELALRLAFELLGSGVPKAVAVLRAANAQMHQTHSLP